MPIENLPTSTDEDKKLSPHTESINPIATKEALEKNRIQERISVLSEQLSGKSFSDGVMSILYPNKDMKKAEMQFDVKNQEIVYNGMRIKLSLPKGASIDSVSFTSSGLKVIGKIGIFRGEGQTSYEQFIKAFDEAIKNKSASIQTAQGDIRFQVV